MSFISYAQNFEDVMLWRALKHIEHGCYVDVGAQHPVIDSVSKAFYEHGWRGVHIEPMPEYAELLRKDRPDETVLQVALADTEGMLELNVIPDTGLSTAVDAYAQRHQVERGLEYQRIQVPMLTLKSALTSLVGKEVHWLKIDVEGLEEKVLKGWDSRILRPWVMVVEATVPSSPDTSYTSWDPILIAADYQFVYFDGLNRFYVAKEHAELAAAFSCPPNVFDNVELSGLASWGLYRGVRAAHEARDKELTTLIEKLAVELNLANEHNAKLQAHAEWLQREWDAAKVKVDELNRSSHHWWTVADGLNRELQRVYASKSLHGTGLLRWTLCLPKRIAKLLVVWAMRQSLANPGLKAHMLGVLSKYPKFRQRLRQFAMRSGLIAADSMMLLVSRPFNSDSGSENTIGTMYLPNTPEDTIKNLSPRTARIYANLQKAIAMRKS